VENLPARLGQRVDELRGRLGEVLRAGLRSRRDRLGDAARRLGRLDVRARLHLTHKRLEGARSSLATGMRARLARDRTAVAALAARLDALSPLNVLGRGYAIATGPDGRIARDAAELAAGTPIVLRLARGRLRCRVEERLVEAVEPPEG
jgi:exodeoxyribonuclease VII large subunit